MSSRLDLKYRPRKFSEVLGNEGVVQLLLKRSRAGTLTEQSMLFGGPKGTGKTTLARIVAMAIVCQDKQDGEPCGSCPSCVSVLGETSTCVEELDAASQGTVDKIREMVRDSEYESLDGTGNIYILDEAQRLSPASQDAMLKAIEDRSITAMMCTTEPHKIRGAMRSRLEEYPISAPSTNSMVSRLESICASEQIPHDPAALGVLAKASQNCPRVCIRAVETMAVSGPVDMNAVREFLRFGSYETVDKILATIDEHPRPAIQAFDELVDREGATWVRDTMLFAVSSGLRIDVGASHVYPCHITFFQTRLRQWAEFARQIGVMDHPTGSGILSSLLSTRFGMVPSTPHAVSTNPIPSVPTPVVSSVPTPVISQSPALSPSMGSPLEIDGVQFSSNERLTTLDAKIGARQEPVPEPESQSVEYRSDMIPMSDREFARGFISRLKS